MRFFIKCRVLFPSLLALIIFILFNSWMAYNLLSNFFVEKRKENLENYFKILNEFILIKGNQKFSLDHKFLEFLPKNVKISFPDEANNKLDSNRVEQGIVFSNSNLSLTKKFTVNPNHSYFITLMDIYDRSTFSLFWKIFLTFLVSTILSFAIFLVLIHRYSKSINHTIKKISEITKSVSLDDYDSKLASLPKNALGDLGREFNYLIKRVRSNLKKRVHIEKIRRGFTSNVSHELKTPLTSIKGYTETLLAGALYENKYNKRFLEIINLNVDRLITLVKDLLELSHIESSEKLVDLSPVSWMPIIKDSQKRLQVELEKKRISFTCESRRDLTKVYGSERALSHIFDNLLQNACYYTQPEGFIHVSFMENSQTLSLSLRDNGIGISEIDQKRVFERFYRVDSSRTLKSGHAGLGLAIVKHLVIQLQGSISLRSSLGKGSEFIVSFNKYVS